MGLKMVKGLHSALSSPVPDRFGNIFEECSWGCAQRSAPLHLKESLAQELCRSHHENLFLAVSLLTFLYLTSGLVACIPRLLACISWLGPAGLPAYWVVTQASVFGFSPRCSHSLPPWLMPLLPLPTVKVMPQAHSQTSHPDRKT